MFRINSQERKILLAIVFFFAFSLLISRIKGRKTEIPFISSKPAVRHIPLAGINSASFGQLISIPGIGPGLAEKIISRRKEKKFQSLEELKQIKGIKKKKFKIIKSYLRLD